MAKAKAGKPEAAPTEPAPAPKKAGKKSKSKSSGGGGFVGLIFGHAEKVIFGAVVALMAFLIWDGTRVTRIDARRNPEDLTGKAAEVVKKLNEPHWTAISESRKIDDSFKENYEKTKTSVNPLPYLTDDWNPVPKNATEKRGDPIILPPKSLQGTSVYGALAVLEPKKDDPLKDLKAAAPKVERRPPASRGRSAQASSSPYGPNGPGGADTTASSASPYGSGGPDGAASGVPSGRRLSPLYDRGFMAKSAGAAGMGSGSPYGGGNPYGGAAAVQPAGPKKEEVARSFLMNVVTASVPHELMHSSYLKEFENAMDYQKLRDQPNYLGFDVQRVDITDRQGKPILESDWVTLDKASSKNILDRRENSWAGECTEFTQKDFVHPKISMPIPPVLIRDYKKFSRHPDVPIDTEDINGKPLSTAPAATAAYGGGMYSGIMGDQQEEAPPPPSYGGGFMGGPQASAAVSSFNFGNEYKEVPNTRTKLLRFYDFEVQPNHVYQYRVRIIMEDPNYPMKAGAAPRLSSLKTDVLTRIQEIKKADEKVGPTERTGFRLSEWSAPSEPIMTVMPGQIYAGEVRPATSQEVRAGNNVISYEEGQPAADMVYVEWDDKRAVEVPRHDSRPFSITPGTVLYGQMMERGKPKAYEIVHPLTKAILEDPGYQFKKPVTVIDIRGGNPLSKYRSADPLTSAGEVLAVDPSTGQLILGHEFEDFDPYRMYTFADEVEAAKPPTP